MNAIVVGTDGSKNAEAAIRRATEIAKGTGATVHLVTAYSGTGSYTEPITASAKGDPISLLGVAESVLARAEREVEAQGVAVETEARGGDPAQVILEVAESLNADLVIVGARGLNAFQRFLLGSVSAKLSQHVPCDLMIVRDEE
jgi:nucleotide-binding universal stress UspA family protein